MFTPDHTIPGPNQRIQVLWLYLPIEFIKITANRSNFWKEVRFQQTDEICTNLHAYNSTSEPLSLPVIKHGWEIIQPNGRVTMEFSSHVWRTQDQQAQQRQSQATSRSSRASDLAENPPQ